MDYLSDRPWFFVFRGNAPIFCHRVLQFLRKKRTAPKKGIELSEIYKMGIESFVKFLNVYGNWSECRQTGTPRTVP